MTPIGFRAIKPDEVLRRFLRADAQSLRVTLYHLGAHERAERLVIVSAQELLAWSKDHPDDTLLIEDSALWDVAEETPETKFRKSEEKFAKKLQEYRDLKPDERTERLEGLHQELEKSLRKEADPVVRNERIWSAGEETFLLAKGALDRSSSREGGLPSADAARIRREEFAEESADSTARIIAAVMDNLGQRMETRKLFGRLGDFEDGSTLAHINRVFIQTAKFLHYIRFNLGLGLENEVKKLFAPGQKYHVFYGHDYARAFREGIGNLAQVDTGASGVAALLHDAGKLPNLDYFESSQAYDRAAIEAHAIVGYDLLAPSGTWVEEAAFVAGSHHEYGGHASGYGLRRVKAEFARNVSAPHLVSFHLDAVKSGQATDHFLNEVMQIVDIYDALRCGRRKYRARAFTESETLGMMKEMAADEKKLNLVLFDLFVGFVAADLSGESLEVSFDATRLFRG